MKLLLTILLCISFIMPTRPIHIIFVVPSGETLTTEEQATAMLAIADATRFWHGRAELPIQSSTTITVAGDLYRSLEWSRPYLTDANPDMTIFVIDNSSSRTTMDGAVGEAQDYYGAVWVVLNGMPGDDGLQAVLAHEMGHVLFSLDDLPPGQLDIMSMPPTYAYHRDFVGCTSLAQMGTPCLRVWAPLVTKK